MENFVAIDLETANGNRSSVCSVGIVIVKYGEIVYRSYSPVRPTPNYYAWFCQDVHGLGPVDAVFACCFSQVWKEAESDICRYFPGIAKGEVPFVAYNAAFVSGCLRAAFAAYGMGEPPYRFCDTREASFRHFWSGFKLSDEFTLDVMAHYCGYDLPNPHNARDKAEACAAIAKEKL